ncbi:MULTISPECIES: lipase secretion chaperone [Pseudomonadaceae]|uniref:lipase secretion chaperone n=1 Tax=Pseudomonadaceae TaxID=135621 RepID=UPI0015E3BFE7|nr:MULTISPECIES: lipase secretion chaperone [Pseudomonadaceae]MBA1279501.1 lipase secretion chaperone [Stutzerimonas stutzeri]MBC8649476.1 lipase secretion chaperone [Pseudomonas sp. MT4]QXY90808.1 lipase secretion chaperone [Pseudomonas sp. MTM4]
MKKLAILFVLAVAIGVLIDWRSTAEPAPTSVTPELPVAKLSAPTQTRSLSPAQPTVQTQATRRLPASFAGTEVDGRLRTDSHGELIIDGDIRRVFDYFLASIGEESIDASVTRLRRHVEEQLSQPAEGQALRLLGQYLDYKRQLLILEKDHVLLADLNAMRERLSAVRLLRAGIFDDHVHQAFFGLDEASDSFTLERLAIRHDSTLDAAAKGAAIDRLRESLPADLLVTLVPQLQAELREQTQALQASGATGELRQLRQQLLGNAATERLEQLDQKRQQWQQRVTAYLEEKALVENSRGLGETEKRAAIERLAAERFDENERKRLLVAEHSVVERD